MLQSMRRTAIHGIRLSHQGSFNYLNIEINSRDDVRHANQIELVDLFGNVLINETMQANQIDSRFYATLRKFQPPLNTSFFYIRVCLLSLHRLTCRSMISLDAALWN